MTNMITKEEKENLESIAMQAQKIALGFATCQEDTDIYRMFGNVSKDYAAGIARGIRFTLHNLKD